MHPDPTSMIWFAQIADAGGLSAAARRLGIPASTLSRRLRELEAELGIRLLERTTRRVRLTEAGELFYRHCRELRETVEAARAAVGALQSAPRGSLRVASSYTLGVHGLSPLLADFLLRYPDIDIQLQLTDRTVDLVAEGIDVGLHAGPLDQLGYSHRLLGRGTMYLYASPAYLAARGRPERPADLRAHLIAAQSAGADTAARALTWRLFGPRGQQEEVIVRPSLVSNEAVAALNVAAAGGGIFLGTEIVTRPYLRSGALQRVLPDWRGPTLEFHAVFPSRRELPPKVRVFIDYLSERLSRELG